MMCSSVTSPAVRSDLDGADGFKWKEIGSGVDSTWAVIA